MSELLTPKLQTTVPIITKILLLFCKMFVWIQQCNLQFTWHMSQCLFHLHQNKCANSFPRCHCTDWHVAYLERGKYSPPPPPPPLNVSTNTSCVSMKPVGVISYLTIDVFPAALEHWWYALFHAKYDIPIKINRIDFLEVILSPEHKHGTAWRWTP